MYPNYNGQYYVQELQNMRDRIDKQIKQINSQTQQQTPITQNFQLAPSTNQFGIHYVTSIDDVNKELVYNDTAFFSKDMSIVWIKNTKGEIKTYELTEIIPKDNKDIQIEYLQAQIEELKKEMVKNEPATIINDTTTEPTKSKKSTNISTISKPTTKSK